MVRRATPDQRLRHLRSGSKLVHPALTAGKTAVIAAAAAYWLFECERAIDFVTSLLARPRRKKVRDTWDLNDLKLGAFVRGQLLLIAFVSTLASLGFWVVR